MADTSSAYVPPGGFASVGTATKHFLNMPMTMEAWQFAGLAFILIVIGRHWGRFVNDFTR